MSSDQIVAVIALSTLGMATVGITVALVVLNRRSPNRRPIRQVWAEASEMERWQWSLPGANLVIGLWHLIRPELPDPYGVLVLIVLTVAVIVPVVGLLRAWRRERRARRGDRDG